MDVVERLGRVQTDASDRPKQRVAIERAVVVEAGPSA